MRYLLTGVDVLVANPSATIVVLGDSTTDGYQSSFDANLRWPDDLARRIEARQACRVLAVSNQGISGNRLLQEGTGPNAQSRFDRDVLSRPGVGYVVLLEGINDIGLPVAGIGPAPTVGDLFQADRQMMQRA